MEGTKKRLCFRLDINFFTRGDNFTRENNFTGRNNLKKGITWIMTVLVSAGAMAAEIKWDGEANDGLWQNPTNWSSNTIPQIDDDVVLDNFYITGSYIVSPGPGNGPISIRSLRITPSVANTITFIIPVSNVASPALRCSGVIYGLVLDPGGIFINESGASSGATVEVADSIRINNDGSYIHRTPRSHAETIRSLSRAAGTEEGVFEFNIPVASSTISLSGQVFGRLRLSPGPGGIINYTGTGTNGLTIRSDLEIMPGVNLSLNLEGILIIRRNLIHNGGILDLGSTARKIAVELSGHFRQSASAITTESGTAQPEIMLMGNSLQELSVQGNITNEVGLKINNPEGVILKSSLSLPYKLSLENGIVTTNEYQVILQAACLLEVSSVNSTAFVNGKIEKKGLVNASFFFPVGKNGTRRWLQIHEAMGDFIVEYLRSDPRAISLSFGDGISHVSSLEYWSITSSGPKANALVELSFDNVNSGGITDLANLRVAWLNANTWQDAGNSATTGSPGSSGSVSSKMQNWPNSQTILYSLASNTANQNPLPLLWKNFSALLEGESVRLKWVTESLATSYFQVDKSVDGSSFSYLGIVRSKDGAGTYYYTDRSNSANPVRQTLPRFYRIVMVNQDSSRASSKIISVGGGQGFLSASATTQYAASTYLSANLLKIDFHVRSEERYQVSIIDLSGRILFRGGSKANNGQLILNLNMTFVERMIYFVRLKTDNGNIFTLKTVVQ
jgi:hypothetical protein